MEYLMLLSLILVWILDPSHSQQFFNPLGKSTNDGLLSTHDEYPYIATSGSTKTMAVSDIQVTPAPSYSMRALQDTPASGGLDPMTYEDYYASIPYYDILDYFYIEEDVDKNNDNNDNSSSSTTTKRTNTTKESQTTALPTFLMTSSTHSQTSYDVNSVKSISTPKSGMISTACDHVTHLGCDITKFERCDPATQTCDCVRGYLKANRPTDGDTACTAAKFLHGDINILLPNPMVSTFSPQALRIIRDKLWDYITYSMHKDNKNDGDLLRLDMRTTGARSPEQPSVLVLPYEIALHRDASSAVTQRLRTFLQDDFHKAPNRHGPPMELTRIIGHTTSRNDSYNNNYLTDVFTSLQEISPCSSTEHTYCATDARCRVENGTHTCGCLPGFLDISPDPLRFPGEVCEEQCQCENSGICVASLDDYKVKECSCVEWFFGPRCQVNGKELLIISTICIACIVIIVTVICCFCQARARHRNRHTESSLFRFTPDTSILKLPRVWMEAHYPDSSTNTIDNKDVSPQSIRRLSIATDCNPYFDGYILEDVPASCIQSERSTDSHQPHHEPPIGTIRGAATISTHSIFRHY